jgi:metal-responsive CopG/Arc/MetJ family transcriptional regulator
MTKTLQAKVHDTYYDRVERIAHASGYPNLSEYVRQAVAEKIARFESVNGDYPIMNGEKNQ